MQQMKLSQSLKSNYALNTVVFGIAVLALGFYNFILAIVLTLFYLLVLLTMYRDDRKRRHQVFKHIEALNTDMEKGAKHSMVGMPLPFVMVQENGVITWYNKRFRELFDQAEMIEQSIEHLIPTLDFGKMLTESVEKEVRIQDRTYRLLFNIFEESDASEGFKPMVMLYFVDITGYKNLKNIYTDERFIMALIQVDNYEDVMNETKEDKRPFVNAEIDKKINVWASRMNALIRKYNSDKYLVVFEHKYLSNLVAKKFSLLDDVRVIEVGNRIQPTLSIGISTFGKNPALLEEQAFSALELALGRGGDQAVIRRGGEFEFFGGKNKGVERRNRVKARIIAHGLRPIMDDSHTIYIMGHRFPDMDSFGSAIGIYRAAINRGKDAFIVMDGVNEAIKSIYAKFADSDLYRFITPELAIERLEDMDLLFVTDTHRPNFTESPELLAKAKRVVVFDHHRRGTEFIEQALLYYLEPYASSTSELVTEVLQYMEKKVILEKIEAEALLAGIVVDTKNFSFKTGVRTFEAAAVLRRFGADTTEVKQLFQDDFSTFVARSGIVANAEIMEKNIAVSTADEPIMNARLVAAQGADALLDIRGIRTSFVIMLDKTETIFISARSLGDINVQLIMEKLGGGGHLGNAGTQFKGKTVEEVKIVLLETIQEYLQESEKR